MATATTEKKARKAAKKPAGISLTADKGVLGAAVDAAARVARPAAAAPIMTCAHLELFGNDLLVTAAGVDLYVSSAIEVEGTQDGTVAVAARSLADVIRSCPKETVTLTFADGRLVVTSGDFEVKLLTQPEAEFPHLPVVEGLTVDYSREELTKALGRVLPAVSKEDSRPTLQSVVLEPGEDRMVIAATDSYRLSRDSLTGAGPTQRTLIPGAALAEVLGAIGRSAAKPENVTIVFGDVPEVPDEERGIAPTTEDRYVRFIAGKTQLVVRPTVGSEAYPNYDRLIPDRSSTVLTVDRKGLLESIGRMRLVLVGGDNKDMPVHLALGAESVHVTAEGSTKGYATEVLAATVTGVPLPMVAFNAAFLADALRATDDETVQFDLIDSVKPVVMTFPGATTYTHLIMPVRVPGGVEIPVQDQDDDDDADEGTLDVGSESEPEPEPEAGEPAAEPTQAASA